MLNKRWLYTLLLFLLTIVIITPNNALAKAPDGTMIGNIPVAGQKLEQIKQTLEAEIALWQSEDDIVLSSEFEHFTVPREVITFDLDATLAEFEERTKRKLTSFFIKPKNVHIPVHVLIDEEHEAIENLKELSYINVDAVLERMKSVASELNEATITISYFDETNIPLENVVEVTRHIPNLSNAVLNYAIDQLDGAVIGADETFSLLNELDFPEAILATDKELSYLGSVLYETFLQGNFAIIERHAHERVPNYTEAGLDARVSDEELRDLIVQNKDDISYKMSLERKEDELHISLQSTASDKLYEYEKVKESEIEQRTIYRYSKDLKPGEEQVVQAGKKGITVETRRNEYSSDESFIDYEVISKDVYLPVPRIILVSSEDEEPDSEEEVTEEEVDEALDELEESVEDFDHLVDTEDERSPDHESDKINIVPIDQLEVLREEQKKLREMFEELADLLFLLEEEMDETLNEQQKKFKELFDMYDEILERLLEDQERGRDRT